MMLVMKTDDVRQTQFLHLGLIDTGSDDLAGQRSPVERCIEITNQMLKRAMSEDLADQAVLIFQALAVLKGAYIPSEGHATRPHANER